MDFTYKIIGFHINDPTYYNWDGSISSYKFNNSFTFAINFASIKISRSSTTLRLLSLNYLFNVNFHFYLYENYLIFIANLLLSCHYDNVTRLRLQHFCLCLFLTIQSRWIVWVEAKTWNKCWFIYRLIESKRCKGS
jgi:hypothetical protein